MMWTTQWVNIEGCNYEFWSKQVTDSHESSTILLSYNNIFPWLLYVTIDLYFEWFEYWWRFILSFEFSFIHA